MGWALQGLSRRLFSHFAHGTLRLIHGVGKLGCQSNYPHNVYYTIPCNRVRQVAFAFRLTERRPLRLPLCV